LMATHQFTECFSILPRHHLGDQVIIANPWCPRIAAYADDSFLFP
jgi:hypothetical protein